MSREAMKLALEALENFEKAGLATLKTIDAITALKQALEQPEPEPVAWIINDDLEEVKRHGRRATLLHSRPITNGIETPLYTSPPKREWQGPTDEEIYEMDDLTDEPSWEQILRFVRAVEAKLKERNT